MGKTKEFTEHEMDPIRRGSSSSSIGPTRQRTTRANRTRSQEHHYPGYYGGERSDTTQLLFRMILGRFRRAWVSLRYRFRAITHGLFKEYTLVKMCVLAGGFYWVCQTGIPMVQGSSATAQEEGTSLFGFLSGGSSKEGGAKPRQTKYKSKNEAAPVSASELFAEEAAAYIEKYASVAREEQAKYGVPASISLAQGLIESRAGTSKLAKSNNNHFGIKCFSRSCRKGHCSNFTDDTHKDFFRKFDNPWGSWREHSQMLSRGRYKSLHKHGTNYRQWAYGLKAIGYATDRTYAEKLIGVIERYGLNKYDG
jgi:flagellum-specific peptidoglycan hydrolase FlgJ